MSQTNRVTAGQLPDHQVADLLEELQGAGLDVRRDLPDPGPEGVPEPGRTVAAVALVEDLGDRITDVVVAPIRRWLDRHGHSPETIVAVLDAEGNLLRQIQLQDTA